jgi:hypothetical protein
MCLVVSMSGVMHFATVEISGSNSSVGLEYSGGP